MYGILAACIAVMAMFLGLFALSVEEPASTLQTKVSVETVQTSYSPKSTE